MSMTEDEMRDFLIRAFNPRSTRDDQIEVGASNLSDPCNRCRAHAIAGNPRSAGFMDAAWGGRRVGTSIHQHIEGNLKRAAATADAEGDDLARLGADFPGLEPERHVTLGELAPGRIVNSTTDLYIPSRRVVEDTKSTDLRKMAFMVDAISMLRGEGPVFGRGHRFTDLYLEHEGKTTPGLFRKIIDGVSEREYADEIEHAKYKLTRYSNQLHLYAKSITDEGLPVDDLFIGLIARDSAMTVDSRDSARYHDDSAPRGIRAIRFAYVPDYAAGLWKSAQAMAKDLESGKTAPIDYPSHPLCGICDDERKREAKLDSAPPAPVELIAADPWAA